MSRHFNPASTVARFGVSRVAEKLQFAWTCLRAVLAGCCALCLLVLALPVLVFHQLLRCLGLTPFAYAGLLVVLPHRFHLGVLRRYEEELDEDFTRATYALGGLREGDPRKTKRQDEFFTAQNRLHRVRATINVS